LKRSGRTDTLHAALTKAISSNPESLRNNA
jgi:hypothetical protein